MAYTLARVAGANDGNCIATLNQTVTTPTALLSFWRTNLAATASGDRLTVARTTGGTLPLTQTPEKSNANTPAAVGVAAYEWQTADPAASGASILELGAIQTTGTLGLMVGWRNTLPRKPLQVDATKQLSLIGFKSGTVYDRCALFAEPLADRPARTIRGRRGRTRGEWFHSESRRGLPGATTVPNRGQLPMEFRLLQVADWDVAPARGVFAGILDSLAGGGTLFTVSLDGALTDAGALALLAKKPLAGTLTDSGALAKLALKVLTGALTDAGALAKQAQKPLAGGITPTGALTASKLASVALAGTLSTAGALILRANKALSGALTTAGTLARQANKALAGTLTDAGALTKRANKPLAGTLTDSGALTNVKVAVLALAGTLTTAGTLARRANKALAATLTSGGALAKRAAKPLAGGLATAGALARTAQRALAGALTTAGALTPAGVTGAVVQAVIRARMAAGAGLHAAATGLAGLGASPAGLVGARVARATIAGARAVARGIAGPRVRSGGGD